jgi:hypothetical protein
MSRIDIRPQWQGNTRACDSRFADAPDIDGRKRTFAGEGADSLIAREIRGQSFSCFFTTNYLREEAKLEISLNIRLCEERITQSRIMG